MRFDLNDDVNRMTVRELGFFLENMPLADFSIKAIYQFEISAYILCVYIKNEKNVIFTQRNEVKRYLSLDSVKSELKRLCPLVHFSVFA